MKWLIDFGNGGSAVVNGDIDFMNDLVEQAVDYGAGEVLTKQEVYECYCDTYDLPYGTHVDFEELLDFASDEWFQPINVDYRTHQCRFVDTMNLDWCPVPPNTQLGLVSQGGPKKMRYRRAVG